MILVSGATGQLGKAVVDHMLRRQGEERLAILARDPDKAKTYRERGLEVRQGDFDDVETLPSAFAGVRLFLLISSMSRDRGPQQIGVVDAASRAGVKHIVYTGLGIREVTTSGVEALMKSHFETEDRIRASGMEWTFLRNTMYADAIPQIIGPRALLDGISLPGGEGRVPYAMRSEMGEATANLLLQSGHSGKTYTFTGNEAWSYGDVAASLSRLTGKPLTYRDIPPEALQAQLQSAGMPDFFNWLTLGTLHDIREGQYDIASPDLEKLLGRSPASLDTMLRSVMGL
jgi:NAD(P)H dehydrogenase (quinone)